MRNIPEIPKTRNHTFSRTSGGFSFITKTEPAANKSRMPANLIALTGLFPNQDS